MNRSLPRSLLRPLPLGAALLMLGSGAALEAGAGRADLAPAGRDEAHAAAATVEQAEDAVQRPARLLRATLSMPYFSFAQSLRPRGRFPQ